MIEHDYKRGDILHWQYNYYGCHPNYYVVTKVTPKGVYLRELPKLWTSIRHGLNGMQIPDMEAKDEILNDGGMGRFHKVNSRGGVLVDSCCHGHAYRWDGNPHEKQSD